MSLVCPSDRVCVDETRAMGVGIVSSRLVGRRILLWRWGSCVEAVCLRGVRASIRGGLRRSRQGEPESESLVAVRMSKVSVCPCAVR